jgi:hypothetical protein
MAEVSRPRSKSPRAIRPPYAVRTEDSQVSDEFKSMLRKARSSVMSGMGDPPPYDDESLQIDEMSNLFDLHSSGSSTESVFSINRRMSHEKMEKLASLSPRKHKSSSRPPPVKTIMTGGDEDSMKRMILNDQIKIHSPTSISVASVSVQETGNMWGQRRMPSKSPGRSRGVGDDGRLTEAQQQKEESKKAAYDRAAKMLKKTDATKIAAEKIERAREAAREAFAEMEKKQAAEGKKEAMQQQSKKKISESRSRPDKERQEAARESRNRPDKERKEAARETRQDQIQVKDEVFPSNLASLLDEDQSQASSEFPDRYSAVEAGPSMDGEGNSMLDDVMAMAVARLKPTEAPVKATKKRQDSSKRADEYQKKKDAIRASKQTQKSRKSPSGVEPHSDSKRPERLMDQVQKKKALVDAARQKKTTRGTPKSEHDELDDMMDFAANRLAEAAGVDVEGEVSRSEKKRAKKSKRQTKENMDESYLARSWSDEFFRPPEEEIVFATTSPALIKSVRRHTARREQLPDPEPSSRVKAKSNRPRSPQKARGPPGEKSNGRTGEAKEPPETAIMASSEIQRKPNGQLKKTPDTKTPSQANDLKTKAKTIRERRKKAKEAQMSRPLSPDPPEVAQTSALGTKTIHAISKAGPKSPESYYHHPRIEETLTSPTSIMDSFAHTYDPSERSKRPDPSEKKSLLDNTEGKPPKSPRVTDSMVQYSPVLVPHVPSTTPDRLDPRSTASLADDLSEKSGSQKQENAKQKASTTVDIPAPPPIKVKARMRKKKAISPPGRYGSGPHPGPVSKDLLMCFAPFAAPTTGLDSPPVHKKTYPVGRKDTAPADDSTKKVIHPLGGHDPEMKALQARMDVPDVEDVQPNGTMLSRKNDYWDTLSTIASTKVSDRWHIQRQQQKAAASPVPPVKALEGNGNITPPAAAAAICGFFDFRGLMPVPGADSKKLNTTIVEDGNDSCSDDSFKPKVPSEIEYQGLMASQQAIGMGRDASKSKPLVTETVDRVQDLLAAKSEEEQKLTLSPSQEFAMAIQRGQAVAAGLDIQDSGLSPDWDFAIPKASRPEPLLLDLDSNDSKSQESSEVENEMPSAGDNADEAEDIAPTEENGVSNLIARFEQTHQQQREPDGQSIEERNKSSELLVSPASTAEEVGKMKSASTEDDRSALLLSVTRSEEWGINKKSSSAESRKARRQTDAEPAIDEKATASHGASDRDNSMSLLTTDAVASMNSSSDDRKGSEQNEMVKKSNPPLRKETKVESKVDPPLSRDETLQSADTAIDAPRVPLRRHANSRIQLDKAERRSRVDLSLPPMSPRTPLSTTARTSSPQRQSRLRSTARSPRLQSVLDRIQERRKVQEGPEPSTPSTRTVFGHDTISTISETSSDVVPTMNDMLSKYDTLVEKLIKEHPDEHNSDSDSVQQMLVELRKKREKAERKSAGREYHHKAKQGDNSNNNRPKTPTRRPFPEFDRRSEVTSSPIVHYSTRGRDRLPTKSPTRERPYPEVDRLYDSSDAEEESVLGARRRELPKSCESVCRRAFSPEKKRRPVTPERRRRPLTPERRRGRTTSPRRKKKHLHSSSSPESRDDSYLEEAHNLRHQLDLARLTSEAIRTSHANLEDELQHFKQKLAQHASMRRGDTAVMEMHRKKLGAFHRRVQDDPYETTELEEVWGDFDEVRGMMLHNVKLMNDAKEALMHERMMLEEEEDDHQVQQDSLERRARAMREKKKREKRAAQRRSISPIKDRHSSNDSRIRGYSRGGTKSAYRGSRDSKLYDF